LKDLSGPHRGVVVIGTRVMPNLPGRAGWFVVGQNTFLKHAYEPDPLSSS